MDRDNRLKLYRKIYYKYYNNASALPDDERYEAIKAGYLLERHEIFTSHNDAIKIAKERAGRIDKADIANAFLYSLSTSLCEYRSPLLSYYYIQSVAPHELDNTYFSKGEAYNYGGCKICNYDNEKEVETTTLFDVTLDIKDRSFQSAAYAMISKYLYGSVCWFAYHIDNCIMDITQYLAMPKVEASTQDKDIFVNALKLIETLNPSDKANAYVKKLYDSKIIPKSTKLQISTLVDTLGSLNILHKANDYAIIKGKDKYDASYRDPIEHKNDRPFPLTHWRASDGVDWGEVQAIFNIKPL